jgi:DNA-binding NarL/FixJ family response regulator
MDQNQEGDVRGVSGRAIDPAVPSRDRTSTAATNGGAAGPVALRGLLTGQELVALQLAAQGYAVEQIAELCGAAVLAVQWDIQRAVTALRATSLCGAIEAARGRGLIL